jgi:uncharacterized membrane protein
MKSKAKSILISYLIGAPTGLITIATLYSLPAIITGETMFYLAFNELYLNAIFGLVIFFLFGLWLAGRKIHIESEKYSLLKTSLFYSIRVNIISWLPFTIISIIDNKDLINEDSSIIPINIGIDFFITVPIFLFITTTLITSFTVGLLICFLIKKLNTTQK